MLWVAVPSEPPKHLTLVCVPMINSASGSVNVVEDVILQPFASVAVTL